MFEFVNATQLSSFIMILAISDSNLNLTPETRPCSVHEHVWSCLRTLFCSSFGFLMMDEENWGFGRTKIKVERSKMDDRKDKKTYIYNNILNWY